MAPSSQRPRRRFILISSTVLSATSGERSSVRTA
jgi:hypothetical protein